MMIAPTAHDLGTGAGTSRDQQKSGTATVYRKHGRPTLKKEQQPSP